MKKIICRFGSKEALDNFGLKVGLTNLTELTKEIYMESKEVKFKRKVKSKPIEECEEWKDMPTLLNDYQSPEYAKIDIYFKDDVNLEELKDIFEQNITEKTTSIWFPRLIHGVARRNYRCVGGENPKYPVYVVSKGRAIMKNWHTSFRLIQMCVPHFIVVEPQEYDDYQKVFGWSEYVDVIKLDMSYKDNYDTFDGDKSNPKVGPGAARNFCWDDSIKRGFEYHWVLDDNIDGFNRYWSGERILARTGEIFRSCERFVERYENIAIAGLNYSKFCIDHQRPRPITLNTRIYSMLLIRNDIDYRWRGRYNEDTDLSLRVLKDGWCTVQFNAFLGEKLTTQRVIGGNTDEFYSEEGTKPKSQMLVDMHPDVATMVWKFNRWHHEVDYSGFKTKLKLKDGVELNDGINNFGMRIVKIPVELANTPNDNRKYIEEHYFDCEVKKLR